MAIIQQYHKDTDTTYVYESESYWVPELGQSRSRRKLLGKLDPATGEIIPCGKRGPKKKTPEGSEEQISASEYSKLRGQYVLFVKFCEGRVVTMNAGETRGFQVA